MPPTRLPQKRTDAFSILGGVEGGAYFFKLDVNKQHAFLTLPFGRTVKYQTKVLRVTDCNMSTGPRFPSERFETIFGRSTGCVKNMVLRQD